MDGAGLEVSFVEKRGGRLRWIGIWESAEGFETRTTDENTKSYTSAERNNNSCKLVLHENGLFGGKSYNKNDPFFDRILKNDACPGFFSLPLLQD